MRELAAAHSDHPVAAAIAFADAFEVTVKTGWSAAPRG